MSFRQTMRISLRRRQHIYTHQVFSLLTRTSLIVGPLTTKVKLVQLVVVVFFSVWKQLNKML